MTECTEEEHAEQRARTAERRRLKTAGILQHAADAVADTPIEVWGVDAAPDQQRDIQLLAETAEALAYLATGLSISSEELGARLRSHGRQALVSARMHHLTTCEHHPDDETPEPTP